jgi:outer membrane protein assembly factor BamE
MWSGGIIHLHAKDWNPKMPFRKSLLLVIASFYLGGCTYFQFPGVHKVEVQQGNIITEDMVVALRVGMTKAQVRYVMGTPLIADTFNQDRWDYFYSNQQGAKTKKLDNLTVYFENGKLATIDRNPQAEKKDKKDKKKKDD